MLIPPKRADSELAQTTGTQPERFLVFAPWRCFYPAVLSAYIAKAVEKAEYEKMENGRYFARIPGFKGLWAEGRTIEVARRELIETLEDWLLLALRFGDDVPVVGGLDLNKIGRHAKTRQPA